MSSSNSDLVDFFSTKPTTFTWVIDDFVNSSDQTSDDIDIRISKYQHELGEMENLAYQFILNYRLKLCLHPNRESRYMVINFGIAYSPNANLSVQYRISLQNEKGEKCHTQEGKCHFIESLNQSNGIYRILRNYLLDKDNGLLPDGKLIVHVEMNVIDKSDFSTNVVTKESLFALSQNYESLLNSAKLSDVVLVADEREFKAHKSILSSRSEVFAAMFEHDLEESKQNRVQISDMSAEALQDLLKFIYTGKVGSLERNACELFGAADMYQIESLKCLTEQYIASTISIKSVPDIMKFAELYELEELKKRCIDYVAYHGDEVEYEDWQAIINGREELAFKLYKMNINKK